MSVSAYSPLACPMAVLLESFPHIERDIAQGLERCALPMSLTAVRFRAPLGGGILEKYHVSPLSILGHCLDVVSLARRFPLKCIT